VIPLVTRANLEGTPVSANQKIPREGPLKPDASEWVLKPIIPYYRVFGKVLRWSLHTRTRRNLSPAEISVLVRKRRIEEQVKRLLPGMSDKAWLAGIIEGEGSVLWAKYGDSEWRAKISIIMDDGAVIAEAARLMGAHAYYDSRRKRWHTYAEGFRAIQTAHLISPHMKGLKKTLCIEMVRVGHIFRGTSPPWRFTLKYDANLGKRIRAIQFAGGVPRMRRISHKALSFENKE
jgi:hypothetical protein